MGLNLGNGINGYPDNNQEGGSAKIKGHIKFIHKHGRQNTDG